MSRTMPSGDFAPPSSEWQQGYDTGYREAQEDATTRPFRCRSAEPVIDAARHEQNLMLALAPEWWMFAPDVDGDLQLVMRPEHPDYAACFAAEHVSPPDPAEPDLAWLDDIIRCLEVGMNTWHDAHRMPGVTGAWQFVGADGPFHELTQSTLRRLKDYRAALEGAKP